MANSDMSADWLFPDFALQILQLAYIAPDLDVTIDENCQTRRIVASILKPLQASQYDRHGIARAYIPNNATHGCMSFHGWMARRHAQRRDHLNCVNPVIQDVLRYSFECHDRHALS
jgi:hypothetical protein